jgi:hypothetical protein
MRKCVTEHLHGLVWHKNISEEVVKVKNRLDATKYVVFIASTCFGHQYAHHQEYN